MSPSRPARLLHTPQLLRLCVLGVGTTCVRALLLPFSALSLVLAAAPPFSRAVREGRSHKDAATPHFLNAFFSCDPSDCRSEEG